MNPLQQIATQIKETLCLPEGSIVFDFYSEDFFDKSKAGGQLLNIVSGKHLFLLDRKSDFKVSFIHSSPGTGTRLAEIDLNKIEKAQMYMFCITWSTTEISFNIRARIENSTLVNVKSKTSPIQLQVGEDGVIYEIGNDNMKNMSLYIGGKAIITATAINSWKETLNAINILLKKDSGNDFEFEQVRSNIILSILVTGFEAYSKKRFLELEKEGVLINTNQLINSLFPKLENNIKENLIIEAKEKKITLLEYLVERKFINFQNYDDSKRAYNKTYNLIFGDLSNDSELFKDLKKYIKFRHKIIHVSAMTSILNIENVPPEEPIFAKNDTAYKFIDTFKKFIQLLHDKTLNLKNK